MYAAHDVHEELLTNQDNIPVHAIRHAARRADVLDAMRDFYTKLDHRIAAQPATCWNKGECCRFGEFGHRLYVTTLEAAYYIASSEPLTAEQSKEDRCPHAFAGKCHARQHRPMGCRIFFCDPAAQHWQAPLTEAALDELRKLHEEFDVPYVYADWMHVLEALGNLVWHRQEC